MSSNYLKVLLGPTIFLFIGLIFFSAGIYFIYSDYEAIKSWKQIKANVLNSSIQSDYDLDWYVYYIPHITYTYSFKGAKHNGSCCEYSSIYSSGEKKYVENFVNRYPTGSGIDILFDPKEPQKSKVKGDVNPFNEINLVFAGFGAAFVLVGA